VISCSYEHLLYSFLTTEPNEVFKPIHKKAMPVILGDNYEIHFETRCTDNPKQCREDVGDNRHVVGPNRSAGVDHTPNVGQLWTAIVYGKTLGQSQCRT
jgi:putative SOS response-associated peptidase YedK